MKLSLKKPAAALAALGIATGVFACASTLDRGQAVSEPPEASAALPEAGSSDAGAASDATDEFTVPDGAVVCDGSPCAVSLTGAGSTFCALLADGTVSCWGSSDQGQLGYDVGPDFPPASASAKLVPGLAAVTSVSVGEGNACATVNDGGVVCWGAPELVTSGLVPVDGGPTNDAPIPVPTRETAVPAATSVALGSHVACVTTASGTLSCWGHNETLELGRGKTAAPFAAPAAVSTGETVAIARPGFGRTFAIASSGALYSWGSNTQFGSFGFLLGRDTSEDPDGVPGVVPFAAAVRAIASGPAHACAISGRLVHCWGSNTEGQLGRGSFGPLFYPPGPTNVSYVVAAEDEDAGTLDSGDIPLQIAAGEGHSCAVMGSGRVYCWGANGGGQLGERAAPGIARSGSPHHVTGFSGPVVHLASGSGATCALLRSGAVECWGTNYLGELGTGGIDQLPHAHPAAVLFPR